MLSANHVVSVVLLPGRTTCLEVLVLPDDPVQLMVDQPADLELRLAGDPAREVVDGFEFGRETLTLAVQGKHSVVIRGVDPGKQVRVSIALRRLPSLKQAQDWIDAEAWASQSKRSRKLADVDESARRWAVLDDKASIARTWLKLGDVFASQADPQSAIKPYEIALEMCRALADGRCIAEAAANRGWAAEFTGEFEVAIECLREATEMWRRLSDGANEGATLVNLGVLLSHAGEFQSAISTDNQALGLVRAHRPRIYAQILNNLGMCYRSLADYDRASRYFSRALSLASRQKEWQNDLAIYRINLGNVLLQKGQLERASATLTAALEEGGKKLTQRNRAYLLNSLGQVRLREHSLDAAQEKLREALRLHRSLNDVRGASAALHHLGLLAQERGDITKAREHLQEAARIRRGFGLRDDAADSLAALAALEFADGKLAAAQELAESGFQLYESVRSSVPGPALRALFYTRKRRLMDLMVEIGLRSPGGPSMGLLAAERGRARALLDLLAGGTILAGIPQDVANERVALTRELNLLSFRLASNSAGRENDLRSRTQELLERDTKIEATIRSSLQESGIGRPLEDVAALQRDILPADSALLEYHLGEQQSHVWLVRRESIEVFDLPPRESIDAAVSQVAGLLGQIIQRQRSPQLQARFQDGLRSLSRMLLGPLAKTPLPRRVILVLDGSLHRVPFDALWWPGSRQRLGLAHDLIRAPSASYLTVGAKPRSPDQSPVSVVAIGDPVFSPEDARVAAQGRTQSSARYSGANFARLPFLEDLETLTSLVPEPRRRIVKGFEASPRGLKQSLGRPAGVLYLSTHATIDDRTPENSRIALSMFDPGGKAVNGFVYPRDLASLRLTGTTVILSACDTGLGKLVMGEGLAGFSTSLFHAGAAQLVLSLAEVDAVGTAQLVSELFRGIFGPQRLGAERALRLARAKLASSKRWADPYYWASFVVMGTPSVPR